MEVVRGIQNLSRSLIHPVVTIGNFDGVHLGHQKIIGIAVEKARKRNGTAVAYTFRPHPQAALRPELNLQLLLTYDEKLEFLAECGLDITVEEPFSREFSSLSPEQFFLDILMRRLSPEAIVVGYDFAFGKGRRGHLETLGDFCKRAGVELTVVPQVEGVSSTRIRQHLAAGEVEVANRLMGREFFYQGNVIRGEARGKKLGFPTANFKIESKLTLPFGVYATYSFCRELRGEQPLPSVTNVGISPTFVKPGQTPVPLVETHLLDTTLDLYGNRLEVRFLKRLREEKKFIGPNAIEELRAQIAKDAQEAREEARLSFLRLRQ